MELNLETRRYQQSDSCLSTSIFLGCFPCCYTISQSSLKGTYSNEQVIMVYLMFQCLLFILYLTICTNLSYATNRSKNLTYYAKDFMCRNILCLECMLMNVTILLQLHNFYYQFIFVAWDRIAFFKHLNFLREGFLFVGNGHLQSENKKRIA